MAKIGYAIMALCFTCALGCSTAKTNRTVTPGQQTVIAANSPVRQAIRDWWSAPPPDLPPYKDDFGLASLLEGLFYLR